MKLLEEEILTREVLFEKQKLFWGIIKHNGLILLLRKCINTDSYNFTVDLENLKEQYFFALTSCPDKGLIIYKHQVFLCNNGRSGINISHEEQEHYLYKWRRNEVVSTYCSDATYDKMKNIIDNDINSGNDTKE